MAAAGDRSSWLCSRAGAADGSDDGGEACSAGSPRLPSPSLAPRSGSTGYGTPLQMRPSSPGSPGLLLPHLRSAGADAASWLTGDSPSHRCLPGCAAEWWVVQALVNHGHRVLASIDAATVVPCAGPPTHCRASADTSPSPAVHCSTELLSSPSLVLSASFSLGSPSLASASSVKRRAAAAEVPPLPPGSPVTLQPLPPGRLMGAAHGAGSGAWWSPGAAAQRAAPQQRQEQQQQPAAHEQVTRQQQQQQQQQPGERSPSAPYGSPPPSDGQAAAGGGTRRRTRSPFLTRDCSSVDVFCPDRYSQWTQQQQRRQAEGGSSGGAPASRRRGPGSASPPPLPGVRFCWRDYADSLDAAELGAAWDEGAGGGGGRKGLRRAIRMLVWVSERLVSHPLELTPSEAGSYTSACSTPARSSSSPSSGTSSRYFTPASASAMRGAGVSHGVLRAAAAAAAAGCGGSPSGEGSSSPGSLARLAAGALPSGDAADAGWVPRHLRYDDADQRSSSRGSSSSATSCPGSSEAAAAAGWAPRSATSSGTSSTNAAAAERPAERKPQAARSPHLVPGPQPSSGGSGSGDPATALPALEQRAPEAAGGEELLLAVLPQVPAGRPASSGGSCTSSGGQFSGSHSFEPEGPMQGEQAVDGVEERGGACASPAEGSASSDAEAEETAGFHTPKCCSPAASAAAAATAAAWAVGSGAEPAQQCGL